MNARFTITPLFKRVIVFTGLFVIISGLIGPPIIQNHALFTAGFWIYGGIGKALLFSLIAFLLLARHSQKKYELQPWQPALLAWCAASAAMLLIAWLSVTGLLTNSHNGLLIFGAHAGIVTSIGFAALGCFGPTNIHVLLRAYRREVMLAGLLAIGFYVFLLGVYALWQPLSAIVLAAVKGLFDASGLAATVVPPHTLLFDKFGITIAEFCSGIESIALFTSLYAIVGLLEGPRLHTTRFIILFPFALLALFGLNILRVYGLIMAGYYINPLIAFSLFHTYAGMIFFILYSALFWSISYKYIVKKEDAAPTAHHETS